jgi:chorismate mutase/prephenate dehydratase
MALDELRERIDAVDDQMAKLFAERMALAAEVGKEKNKTGAPIENTAREKEILNRVVSDMPEDIKLYAKQVFGILFDTSKAYQSGFVDLKSHIKEEIAQALIDGWQKFPASAVVACQGVLGAYSSIAADKLFSISNHMYFKDFEGVFNAVERGMCEFGVLPIENSLVGSVNAVYDLMARHKFYIAKSVKLSVKHYLLANAGTRLSDVKEIFSHEQAFGQCAKFLQTLKDVKLTPCENTAIAAKRLAESGRRDAACIASRECAGYYGLSVLQPNIQDNDNNYTRFIAISKKFKAYENAGKISIMVNLPHQAGSLNRVLNKFSALSLNLTKIESRPIPNSAFEFSFYFDFDAKIQNVEVQNLLSELERTSDRFVFLGSYEED